jgi:hypothetical protein
MILHKSKNYERGKYLGYDYILKRKNMIWASSFGDDNYWLPNSVKSFTRNGAKEKMQKRIADFHFSRVENWRGSKYDKFKT